MRIVYPVFLSIFITAPLLADDWTRSFPMSGNKHDLTVHTDDASVTVRPWDRNEIEARVTTSGWKIADSEARIIEQHSDSRLDFEVRLPKNVWSRNHRWVKVELRVPRETRVNIHTGDGAISVEGLRGATVLSTGDGRIDAQALDGTLEARSGDGSIHVRGRLDALDLHTGDGSIEAEVSAGSRMASPWRLETGDGSVTLRLPASFAADIRAHTGDGSISVDLPVTSSGTPKRSDFRGKINGGGELLSVQSGDGSIHLTKL
jgi:DUF4097 and DUF4098 domain-containing protein YvlB